MLRHLRKYSTSTAVKILYGTLAALFVIWGVGVVGGERVDAVATVHGQPITRQEVDRAEVALQRRYEMLLRGATLPRGFDLRGQALEQLIDTALLQHEADRLGLGVHDAEIVKAVTEMPEFQENGRFSRDVVERVLSVQRDRGEFEDQVRRQVLVERLQALVTDGVQVTDAELRERYRFDQEQVELSYARVAGAELGAQANLSDEELQKHLDEHAERYRQPTRVRARYAAYRAADFGAAVQPTDEDVTRYYETHKDTRFSVPEQARVRQILVRGGDDAANEAARKEADDAKAKLAAGGDFAALASQHSDDAASAKNGGDLGLVTRQGLPPDLANVAFALEPGTVSDVVQGPEGFYLFKLEEKQPAGPKPLDAVREEIVQAIRSERGLDLARNQLETDRRAIVRGTAFAEAVGSRPLQETPPFGESEVVPGLGRLPEFSQAAFALGEGQVSHPIETDDAIYLLAPFGRVESHVPPLAEVRDRVLVDARRARGEALAKEKAEGLRAKARALGLEKAAAEAGLTVESTGLFDRRTGPKALLSADLRTDAFALTPEKPVADKVYPVGSDAVVVALKERKPADPAGFDGAKDALRDTLLQQKRASAMEEYMRHLKQRAQQDGELDVPADALARG